jgi:glycosyltransferase involved in cell wall biosynthesis
MVDWSLDDVYRTFHNVYLSPEEELTPDALLASRGSPLSYDVIDLQFHLTGFQIDAFRRIGAKIIYTPMESMIKVALMNLRTNPLTMNCSDLRNLAASFRSAYEEVFFALKVDEMVCVSHSDATVLRAVKPSRRLIVLETGVSQYEFAEMFAPSFVYTNSGKRRCSIVLVAYFGSETNVAGLRWYLDNVHLVVKVRVPDYVLTVVGRGDLSPFFSYQDGSIEFVGPVEAIAPYIQEARVAIAPAISGAGFRGKINQYAIVGIPSVVTPIAHNGLLYQDSVNIFISEKPADFANRCIRLLTDLELNDRMGQAARELTLANYSWQSKLPIIRKIYNFDNFGKEGA